MHRYIEPLFGLEPEEVPTVVAPAEPCFYACGERVAMSACGSRLRNEEHTWNYWLQIHKRVALFRDCEYLAIRNAEAPKRQLLHASTSLEQRPPQLRDNTTVVSYMVRSANTYSHPPSSLC